MTETLLVLLSVALGIGLVRLWRQQTELDLLWDSHDALTQRCDQLHAALYTLLDDEQWEVDEPPIAYQITFYTN